MQSENAKPETAAKILNHPGITLDELTVLGMIERGAKKRITDFEDGWQREALIVAGMREPPLVDTMGAYVTVTEQGRKALHG